MKRLVGDSLLELAKMFARNIAEGRLKCKQNTPGESKRPEKEAFETARQAEMLSFFLRFCFLGKKGGDKNACGA